MTAKIIGKHRRINCDDKEEIEKGIVDAPTFVPAGAEVEVPYGKMVLMRTSRADEPSTPIWTRGWSEIRLTQQGPFLIEAASNLRIQGPAFVSTPRSSTLGRELENRRKKFGKATAGLNALLILLYALIWEFGLPDDQKNVGGILMLGIVMAAIAMGVYLTKKIGRPSVFDSYTFPKGIKQVRTVGGRYEWVDVE